MLLLALHQALLFYTKHTPKAYMFLVVFFLNRNMEREVFFETKGETILRKKLASLLVTGGLLATLSLPGLFIVQQNHGGGGGCGLFLINICRNLNGNTFDLF